MGQGRQVSRLEDSVDQVRCVWLLSVREMLLNKECGLDSSTGDALASSECDHDFRGTKEQQKERAARRLKYKETSRLIREAAANLEKAAGLMGAVSWGAVVQ